MLPYYKKKAFKDACMFAKANNITQIKDNEGKYLFLWELGKTKYALGNKRTKKPEGNYIYFTKGIESIEKVYTYQLVRYLVTANSEKILNDFCGYNIFNSIGKRDEQYKYDSKTNKLSLGYKNSEIYLLKYLKERIDPKGDNEIGFDELICYFQDKLNFKLKYPFYGISQSKMDYIDSELNKIKEHAIQSKPYFNLIYECFNELYTKHLFSNEGKSALNYLIKRGLTIEEIKQQGFGLGFSGDWLFDGYQEKLNKFLQSKLTNDEYQKFQDWSHKFEAYNPYLYLGLLNQTVNGRYDSMINRITIPIKNSKGEIVAFGGRDYLEIKNDIPKYLITKSSINWQKSENVYGYQMAIENIKKSKNLMVVEGFMDALALNKIGIPAIALMGVNCSNTQANLIKSINSNAIYVSLDFDEAGESNSDKVTNQLKNNGLEYVERFNKPEEIDTKDFDEFINQKYKDVSNEDKYCKIAESFLSTPANKKNIELSMNMES